MRVSAQAAEPAVPGAPVEVEIGNGLHARIGGPSGGLILETGQAGITWDSTIAGVTRLERFGAGWSLGIPYVDFSGGVAVYVPGHGLQDHAPARGTGLAGGAPDVRFELKLGTIPARSGVVGAQSYVATLQHLSTGVTDYFDAEGNAIVSASPAGRIDRDFSDPLAGVNTKHLRSVTDDAGRVTKVTYDGHAEVTRPDGVKASFSMNAWGGVARISTVNGDDTEWLTDDLAYVRGEDGIDRIELARYVDVTGQALATLDVEWAEDVPGAVREAAYSNAWGDFRVVYQR